MTAPGALVVMVHGWSVHNTDTRNQRDFGTVTYFLNHDLLSGSPAIPDPANPDGPPLRAAIEGVGRFGLRVEPHQTSSELFVRFAPAGLSAKPDQLELVLKPNQTTLVDVVLRRVVGEGTFLLTTERAPTDFRKQPPGRGVPPFE